MIPIKRELGKEPKLDITERRAQAIEDKLRVLEEKVRIFDVVLNKFMDGIKKRKDEGWK
jgi:hypothetical protein